MTSPAEAIAAKKPPRRGRKRPVLSWVCHLKQRRKDLGLTLKEVAAGSGIHLQTIHTLEGGTDPLLSTARQLAEFFGAPVEEIWTEKIG